MAIGYVDGRRFAAAIVGGAQWVAAQRVHLNEINVFPVPDGDTGSNLTFTLKAAADAVRAAGDRSLGEVAAALSRAVLHGARGNAGIILAQFLRCFAREVQGLDRLYAPGFASALRNSVSGAYEAMAEPTEGTILTVIRDAVGEAERVVLAGESDFVRIVEAMLRAGRRSLERTPELLPVLKEAGVVDAGGEGFVDLLDGILRVTRGEEVGDVLDRLPQTGGTTRPSIAERDLKYRYCTEFLVEGPDADPLSLKVRLAGLGGSVMVVGGPGLVRAHIHTNEPERAISAAAALGEVTDRKIDDMREQHREFIRALAAERPIHSPLPTGRGPDRVARSRRDRARAAVRIVTDSTADLSPETAAALGITVVPLTVAFEDGSYRDGVDLTPVEFYDKLESAEKLPTTSQPTPADFRRIYETLSAEADAILSIHISSKMSGTVRSALAGKDGLREAEVRVVDSGLVSAPLGLAAIEAAKAAKEGADIASLESLVAALCARARVYFTVGSLDHLVRGGRIGRARALVGRLAGVRPILTIEEGEIAVAGRARGERGVVRKLLELAEGELTGSTGGTLGVVRAVGAEVVDEVARTFVGRFGFDSVEVFELGAIVGTHVGPGTWGVSYLLPG